MISRLFATLLLALGGPAWSLQMPTPQADARIGVLTYSPNDVYGIVAQRGRVVQIELPSGERMKRAPLIGDRDGWIVEATVGSGDLFLKPKSGASATNLLVVTDCCSYAFDLVVLAEEARSEASGLVYRVRFMRPQAPAAPSSTGPSATVASEAPAPAAAVLLQERLAAPPEPRNWAYSVQAPATAEAISPTEGWDDGRFTYLRFPANRELPQAFRVDADGSEHLVNRHVSGDLLVLHEVARRWVLRLGRQAVGVWNEAFDAFGIPPVHGTTVDGVRRVPKLGGGS